MAVNVKKNTQFRTKGSSVMPYEFIFGHDIEHIGNDGYVTFRYRDFQISS